MTKKGSSAASSPSANGETGSSAGRFVCSLCAKVYRSGAGLRYHKRKRHRGMTEPTALHRVKCQEPGCTYQMLAISDLRNHLSNHHHKTEYKCTEEKKFTSIADFTDWKSSFESSTGSKYVKNCGAKGKSDNQTTEYYYCNRTGPFGQGLRRNKAQGSARAGIHCTSSMKVEIQTDEHITVQYYPAHYGHSNASATDEQPFCSEQDRISNGASHSHVQEHSQSYPTHPADRSSSSSPGSSSTSPSAGSNSNSIHHQSSLPTDRHILSNSVGSSQTLQSSSSAATPTPSSLLSSSSTAMNNNSMKSNNLNPMQSSMSHCIIITPSLMLEDHPSMHSTDHHTPVFVVQQHLPPNSSTLIAHPSPTIAVKKEKCVSDIMHEAFQLLSYWPLDHPSQNCISTENEQQVYHSQLNMDEHLMF